MRLILKASCIFLLVMLLMIISFGNFEKDSDPLPRRGRKVEAKERSLVDNYVNSVGHCLRVKTRIGVAKQTLKALEEIWRILPIASDQCSVNAQISLRSYSTLGQYNIYFIQNMNTTLAATKCTIVSIENPQGAEAEDRLLMENSKCRLLAIAEKSAHNESDSIRNLPLSVLTTRTEGVQSDGEGIMSLLKNRVGDVVDLLVIASEKNSYDYAKLILTEANDDVVICQVNLLYHEPRTSEIPQFFEFIKNLTHDERYLLMRADRDRNSLNMQLFFVNHHEPYCLDRYLRMYTFD